MNPDIKAKWLDLLRSGEFVQGHSQLGVDTSEGVRERCCLGVLCEVAVREGVIQKKVSPYGSVDYGVNLDSPNGTDASTLDGDYESAKYYLPTPVRVWAGIEEASPKVPIPDDVSDATFHSAVGGQVPLANLNDAEPDYDFRKIADQIERHL